MRRPLFMANWKMNLTPSQAQAYKEAFKAPGTDCDIVICPPFPALERAKSQAYGLGSQDVSPYQEGAYTGEVSTGMLKDLGVTYILVGHSERRTLYGEDDGLVRAKFNAVVAAGLTPVLCIGEDHDVRQRGQAHSYCWEQVKAVLADNTLPNDLVLAYEPVWAIGTGQSADTDTAQSMLADLRKSLSELLGHERAQQARFLYGGSVNRDNIGSYLRQKDIDGALVGGASLDPQHFADLIRQGSGQNA